MGTEISVKKTTFEVEGCKEPCIEVSNGCCMVRISKCHRLIGRSSLYIREYLDGFYNGEDEFTGNFDSLSDEDAIRLARQYSAYL